MNLHVVLPTQPPNVPRIVVVFVVNLREHRSADLAAEHRDTATLYKLRGKRTSSVPLIYKRAP